MPSTRLGHCKAECKPTPAASWSVILWVNGRSRCAFAFFGSEEQVQVGEGLWSERRFTLLGR